MKAKLCLYEEDDQVAGTSIDLSEPLTIADLELMFTLLKGYWQDEVQTKTQAR